MAKVNLRIIVDADLMKKQQEHVQKMLLRKEELEMQRGEIIPYGIPLHNARYPNHCDECGMSYWSNDPYTMHIGCKGTKHAVGFRTF